MIRLLRLLVGLQRFTHVGLFGVVAASAVMPHVANADTLRDAIRNQQQTHGQAAQSQQRIDRLQDDSQQMLQAFRNSLRQTRSLQLYVQQLEKLTDAQLDQKLSLQEQLSEIEVTRREILPLLLKMVSTLEQFVAADLPFLATERQKRVKQLQNSLDSVELSIGQKLRQVLEAYQIENEYGRSLGTERQTITLEQNQLSVDVLRIGRVALYFRTLDGERVGRYIAAEQRWQYLPNEYLNTIAKGLRIAQRKAPPDVLRLPVPPARAQRKVGVNVTLPDVSDNEAQP